MAGKRKTKSAADQASAEPAKKSRRGRGKQTSLNPAVQKAIVRFIHAGSYVETACAAAGIHKDTFYTWLKRGAVEKKGIYKDFSDAVQKAMAMSEIADIATVGAASKTQWQAAAWRLERRFPSKWGRREHHVHGVKGAGSEVKMSFTLLGSQQESEDGN